MQSDKSPTFYHPIRFSRYAIPEQIGVRTQNTHCLFSITLCNLKISI